MEQNPVPERRRVSVAEFYERASSRLALTSYSQAEVLAKHQLDSPRVQKLGLALSGFAESIHSGRIQIYGNSERSYIGRLDRAEIDEAYGRLDRSEISCILVSAGVSVKDDLRSYSDRREIPLLATPVPSSETITAIWDILSDALAPCVTIHGVLMEVYGIGVLIVGESGVGKSECALDLITRGHRLISDDSVSIKQVADRLHGSPPESIRDFLEIRGLGIINARELFGVSALADSAEIKFCIEFSNVPVESGSDRLGLESTNYKLLKLAIPKYALPVTPGRNLATLVEAAVRVFASRQGSASGATDLIDRHNSVILAERS